MTGVRGLAHANLRAPAAMIERLRRFYTDVVGLREGPRPTFRSGSRGHWLYAGDTDVLHLTIASPGDAEPQATGMFNAAGLAYQIDEVDERGQVQLFLIDPCGLAIELNFQR